MRIERKLSRREFVTATGLGLVGIALALLGDRTGWDPVFKIEFDKDNESLSFDEAATLAIRLDRAVDALPDIVPNATPAGLYRYAAEILPQFEYEGIVPRTAVPDEVAFALFLTDPQSHNHVLGRSDCENWAVLNARMGNPISSWYQDDIVAVLTHELAHVAQGKSICRVEDRGLVENSAQIAAVEVMAGLGLAGNAEFLGAAVEELRGMAISTAYGLALQEGKLDDFIKLRSRVSPGAASMARFERSRRRWADDPDQLAIILDRYSIQPLNMIVRAIRENGAEITGLAFPAVFGTIFGGSARFDYTPQPIKLDDTKYLLEYLEEIVADTKEK